MNALDKELKEAEKASKYGSVAEKLNYYLLLEDGIILHKDDRSFSINFEVKPPDTEVVDDNVLSDFKSNLAAVLGFIKKDYNIEANIINQKVKSYIKGTANRDILTQLIEEEKYQIYTDDYSDFYESKIYYTITWSRAEEKPALTSIWNKLKDFFKKIFFYQENEILDDEELSLDKLSKAKKEFKNETRIIKGMLEALGLRLNILTGYDLYSFLYRCVNETNYDRVKFSSEQLSEQMYLADAIADSNMITGKNLMVGDKHVRLITIEKEFKPDWYYDVLEELHNSDMEFRISMRYSATTRSEAVKDFQKRVDALNRGTDITIGGAAEAISGVKSKRIDTNKQELAEEMQEALHNAKKNVYYGQFDYTIVLSDGNKEVLDEKVLKVQEIVKNYLYTPSIETGNPTDVFFGTIPSHLRANDRFLSITNRYFACLMPTSGITQGSSTSTNDLYSGYPALSEVITGNNRKAYINFIDGDNGDIMLIGSKGGGKTSCAIMIMGDTLARQDGTRVIFADWFGGAEKAIFNLEGKYLNILDGKIQLAPFQRAVDESYRINFLLPFLNRILLLKVREEKEKREGIYLNEKKQENSEKIINDAVNHLIDAHKKTGYSLTFNNFIKQISDIDIQEKFKLFLDTLPKGLFDGSNDDYLWEGDLIGYDKTNIVFEKSPSFYEPILAYLNNRFYDDTRPTLFIRDEFRTELNNEYLRDQVTQSITTDRHKVRYNLYILQSITDLSNSLKQGGEDDNIIFDINLKNYIFVPDKNIKSNENIRKVYKRLGLTDRILDLFSIERYGRYYIKSEWQGFNRFVDWLATPIQQELLLKRAGEDIEAMKAKRKEYTNHDEYIKALLVEKGFLNV